MLAPYRQAALGEHNDVVREIASDTGMPMYDLAANFPYDQSLWTDDGVHMTAPGLLEQAEQYAAFIVEQELVSSPNP
jgi:hypothetical protein